jgi:hypothetical protein
MLSVTPTMKKIVLLLIGVGLLYGIATAASIGLADWKNRSDPAGRFLTEGPPTPAAGVVATEYQSLGATCRTRSWTLTHTPEQLKTWVGSADFQRADQRLAGIRQQLEPEVRPPFKDKKYSAAYAQKSQEGHYLLVFEGGQRSCFVVIDRPFRGGMFGLFGDAPASK